MTEATLQLLCVGLIGFVLGIFSGMLMISFCSEGSSKNPANIVNVIAMITITMTTIMPTGGSTEAIHLGFTTPNNTALHHSHSGPEWLFSIKGRQGC